MKTRRVQEMVAVFILGNVDLAKLATALPRSFNILNSVVTTGDARAKVVLQNNYIDEVVSQIPLRPIS